MKNKPAPARYTVPAISFHWLVGTLIIIMLCVGLYMTGMANTPTKFTVYQLHKSVGLTILILATARLLWRFTHPAPMLPKNTPTWQKVAAHTSHFLLYFLMFAMPISGWLFSDAAGYHPSLFGLPVPLISGHNPQLSLTVSAMHTWGAYLLIGLLVIHVGAAIQHHLINRDEILNRMLPRSIKLPRPRIPFMVLALLAFAASTNAQVWNINPTASRINFTAKFNGEPVNGSFKNWFGKIYFDPKNLPATDITITINTNSVSSGEMGRDQTLQTPDWFNSAQYPNAVFTTKSVVSTGPNTYFATGNLSLAGVTKPMQFPFKLDINGNNARLFTTFPLSRSLFGVGKGVWQTNTEIADGVSITLIVNAVQQ